MLGSTLVALLTGVAFAAPATLTHQGRVLDGTGAPLDGPHDLTVSLYDAATGGAAIWTETVTTDLDDGYFSVVLGHETPLDDAILAGERWVGLAVDDNPELAPRHPLTSVPYAMIAGSVSGGVVDASEIRVDGATVFDADGALAVTVDWSDIENVPPLGAQLDDLGCAEGDVPRLEGGAWTCALDADHLHDATDLITGTLAVERLPVGTGSNELAAGNHEHTQFSGDLSLSGRELRDFRVHNAASSPSACDASAAGALYFDTGNTVFYGCDGATWIPLTPIGVSRWKPAESCKEVLESGNSAGSGTYWLAPFGPDGDVVQAWCDMETDGGGWTVLYAGTGADGEVPMVSDALRGGNPFASGHLNTSRAFKMAMSAVSTESVFVRPGGPWLRVNRPLFDADLVTEDHHAHYPVTLTTSDDVQVSAYMGYSVRDISGGGDFNLTATSCSDCTDGVDHHSADYWHLNSNCEAQYFYSYSTTAKDGDAGYDVNTGLGAWGVTQDCHSYEGGALKFYAAVR